MANIFTDLWTKLKIDYREWRIDWISDWNFRRKQKLIRKATRRARIRNSEDGRTYYIIEDLRGGISALHKDELNYWTSKGLFKKMTHNQLLWKAIDIITSNRTTARQFIEIKTKREARNNE